jgi:hypothetical protein
LKILALTIIPLMLLSSILLVPITAHSQLVGQVSVNGGSPESVPASQTTLSVPIMISGSDALNGFDVLVKTNPSILYPTGVTTSGSILSSAPVLVECINGILVAGNTCAPQDGIGVVDLSKISTANLSPPVSGLLFTINYNIVGSTTGSPISFNTGCSNTSTGTSDCVFVYNGGQTPVPETDLNTVFANLVTFTMTPAYNSVSTPSGTPITDAISYAALGGYADYLDESCSATSGLTCSFASSGSSTSAAGIYLNGTAGPTYSPTGSDTLTITGTTSGSVTAAATGEGYCSCGVVTQSTTISVVIAPAGFTISLSQSFVKVSRGNSDPSTTINLAGVSLFSGTVSFTSTATAAITGTAPSATLTPNGSGDSSATSTLTISVSSSVTTGNYTLTVTGTSGSSTSSATITVDVPGQDFSIIAVPNPIFILRGGSVASTLTLSSLANFAGTVSLSATIAPIAGQQDSCCLTNNTTPEFSSTVATLTAGGSAQISFFAGTVGGTAPPATFTSTGNYTATITATSGLLVHTSTIFFTVVDFSIGPTFCTGSTIVQSTPSDFAAIDLGGQFDNGTFAGLYIGPQCATLTITDQPNVLAPFLGGGLFGEVTSAQLLWLKANAYGGLNGLVTNGWNGTPAIALLNNQIPVNGVPVPALAVDFPANGTVVNGIPEYWPDYACLLPTFFANGTQVPYSWLETHGPLIIPGTGLWPLLSTFPGAPNAGTAVPPGEANWGCKFDAAVFPNDAGIVNSDPVHGAIGCSAPFVSSDTSDDCGLGIAVPRTENPDYNAIMAMSLNGTLPGDYSFQVCGQYGVLVHCSTFGLDVIAPPQITLNLWAHSIRLNSKTNSATQFWFIGVNNPNTTPLYVQVQINGVSEDGTRTFQATSSVEEIQPSSHNPFGGFFFVTQLFTLPDAGHTFTFTLTLLAGSSATALTAVITSPTAHFRFVPTSGTFRVLPPSTGHER